MRILITNDDSHRSPLLQLAVDFFSRLGEVHLVVPLHEQSWTSKSMSRFEALHVQKGVICGKNAFSVSGSPADCVNLAIHNLLPAKPDLVVSGINAGFNMGIGFIWSSGTVGACLEANIAGVPGIALSQAFDTETRNQYSSDYMIPQPTLDNFASATGKILQLFVEEALCEENKALFLATPVTWNINFPFALEGEMKLYHTPISETRYGQCFQEASNLSGSPVSVYQRSGLCEVTDLSRNCDSTLVRQGKATLSLLDMWAISHSPKAISVKTILESFDSEENTGGK